MVNKLCIIIVSLALAACVTINIYFPAAEAQEVADQIIDDVWQLKNGDSKESGDAAKQPEPETNAEQTPTEASESK